VLTIILVGWIQVPVVCREDFWKKLDVTTCRVIFKTPSGNVAKNVVMSKIITITVNSVPRLGWSVLAEKNNVQQHARRVLLRRVYGVLPVALA
jgi:hypothetical protein